MEEAESAPAPSRKELRKQKLMEYLAAKGKMKPPITKSFPHEDCQVKKPSKSAIQAIKGKENKAPDQRFGNIGFKGPRLTESRGEPVRKVFGVTSRGNLKGQKDSTRPSSTLVSTQPRLNPALIRTYTVSSSTSSLNSASQLKKQPGTGLPQPARASLKEVHTASPKLSLSSRTACSGFTNNRLSIGPFVKTRTGLIPAVTQQRSTKSDSSHIFGPAAGRNTSQRGNPASSTSVSQSRRGLCPPGTGQRQNKPSSKAPLSKPPQPSSGSQPSSGLKSASSFFKCTAAPLKPLPRITTVPSACPPAKRSSKPKSEQEKTRESCRAALQASSQLAPSYKAMGPQAAAAETATKRKTGKETDSRFKNSSTNVQARAKLFITPSASQTMLPRVRTVGLTSRASHTKTPKIMVRVVPQTEGKKPTAAQEDRQRKLQEWREARGISYKRPPMPVKPPARRTASVPLPFWESLKEDDEAHTVISAVDRSLADCIKLLQEGCPPEQVRGVLSRLPLLARKFAKYWICLVRLKEREGDRDVLPLFEEAVRVVLEPVDELRTVVFEILKKKDELQACEAAEEEEAAGISPVCSDEPLKTPKPVRALIWGQDGDSSVVKYKITNTPGGAPSSQSKEASRVNGQEVRFFTPVRRSVRIQRASRRHPPALQDHDVCVTSYSELEDLEEPGRDHSPSNTHTPMYVYRENEALKEQVFVQLVHEDSG